MTEGQSHALHVGGHCRRSEQGLQVLAFVRRRVGKVSLTRAQLTIRLLGILPVFSLFRFL